MSDPLSTMPNRKLRIGIDASWACGNLTGTGRFTHDLTESLTKLDSSNTYFLYFRECCKTSNPLYSINQKNVLKRVIHSKSRIFRILLPLSFQLRRDSIDVFLSTAYFLPLFGSKKWIVTFFDFNIFWLAREWSRPGTIKGLMLMRLLFPISIRKADHIVTISLATQNDLRHFFPQAGDKSSVIYPGVNMNLDENAERDKMNVRKSHEASPFFLYVGDLSPTKNLERFIWAFSNFKKHDQRQFKFLFVGKDVAGYLKTKLYPLTKSLRLEEFIEFCGYVSNEHLVELYSGATCLVYASLREGFGYPIVEAMHYGLPVITSNISSCPEVGGDAALYVNPSSIEELSLAMNRITQDESLRRELAARGRDRVRLFSVQAMATQYLSLLNRIGVGRIIGNDA